MKTVGPFAFSAIILVIALMIGTAGCFSAQQDTFKNSATSPADVTISWTANREKAVNSAGGGYKVYYSTTHGFALPGATVVNVPYVSGSSAPTSTLLSKISPGTYYLKIVAYSALNPPFSSNGAASAPSEETSFTVAY